MNKLKFILYKIMFTFNYFYFIIIVIIYIYELLNFNTKKNTAKKKKKHIAMMTRSMYIDQSKRKQNKTCLLYHKYLTYCLFNTRLTQRLSKELVTASSTTPQKHNASLFAIIELQFSSLVSYCTSGITKAMYDNLTH